MKHLILIALLLISVSVNAQTNYEKGMQKAFQLWSNNNPVEASNVFERIAAAEKDNWLPAYYAAQIKIVNSFDLKDEEKLRTQLKKAQDLINDITAISKKNPEIMVLQALLHTVWVAYDGATYGRSLSPKINALYTKASKIAPDNPRVMYSKAEWNMNSAKYFGQDTSAFCKDLEKAIELFTKFKPETAFHPNWGKERAIKVFESCEK